MGLGHWFGAGIQGTDRDGSDLDLLVDALPGATLLDLGDLEAALKSLLGVNVDPARQRYNDHPLPSRRHPARAGHQIRDHKFAWRD